MHSATLRKYSKHEGKNKTTVLMLMLMIATWRDSHKLRDMTEVAMHVATPAVNRREKAEGTLQSRDKMAGSVMPSRSPPTTMACMYICLRELHERMHVCDEAHLRINTQIQIYMHLCVCTYACICVCMYVCVCIYIYIYIYIYICINSLQGT
jgi:hypothetical protein